MRTLDTCSYWSIHREASMRELYTRMASQVDNSGCTAYSIERSHGGRYGKLLM